MKKIVTSVILLASFTGAFSQISLSLSDMPIAGQTQRVAIDTFPLPAANFGNKGANQSYDFSNYTLFKYDTIEYRTPTSGQLSTCPNTDVATTIDGVNFILTNNDPANGKVTLEGFEGLISGNVLGAAYSTKPDFFRFPVNYLTNFAGTGYLQKTVPGSQVGQPLATSVELTINTTAYSDTIDGWGKVKTPVGTYKCLRKQRKETTTTTIRALIFGTWSTISNSTSTSTRYSYLTKEARGSVINFNYDTANILQSVNWSMIPPAAPIADFGANNTSGGLVLFTDSTDGYPDTYSWNYGDGSANGTTQNPNHTYAANGAYYVCLTVVNAGGSNTFCDSVYVTGISAANNPPVAFDDTVSLLQATTIIIFHVAANDIDPDGDNICMTAVWGSPYVTEYIGGSCDMVSIIPDSTFVGTDTAWYQICDNGTPVLCDTGLIIFTVLPDPALLPLSAFSTTPFTYGNCIGSITTSSSTNAASLAWAFHPFSPVQPDSVYSGNSVQYYGDMSSTISLDVQVCLTATNQFGTSTKCDTVDLSCITSIHDVSTVGVSVYPNPATNTLTIDMQTHEGYTAIEIYNAIGEKVKLVSKSLNNKVVNITVSELQQGMYVVTTVDAKGVRKAVGRFTKE